MVDFYPKKFKIVLKLVKNCQIVHKYPFTGTLVTQPQMKLQNFGRWHMKYNEHNEHIFFLFIYFFNYLFNFLIFF